MSDKEEDGAEKPFYVDRAKTGRASCKKCRQKIDRGELRFAKLGQNPFGSGSMKMWHHIPCIFETFKRQRATTKKIEGPDDIGGWFDISEDDRNEIKSYFLPELKQIFDKHKNNEPTAVFPKKGTSTSDKKENEKHKDMSFRAFRKLCADIADSSSYNLKTSIIKEFFKNGSDKTGFKGDVILWCMMLLPGVVKRNYNLQSKQLIKIFSRILGSKQESMLNDLEKGDVAETISKFFEESKRYHPARKSTLTLREVDEFLKDLSLKTREDDQVQHFTEIIIKCTTNDLKMLIRLVKHDLRINAGAKHILEALHPDAYKAFQSSRDIKAVIKDAIRANEKSTEHGAKEKGRGMSVNIKLMTPVIPMLAQACRSAELAMKKFPDGVLSEIKYDGERIQLHKRGNEFKYFSRSLKPVLPHKVNHFKDYIPQAFPHASDLILDGEILLVDKSGKPLPFGTLGIHKRKEFKDAHVCLYIFDCIYLNGRSLISLGLKERKEILRRNMVEVKNYIMISNCEEIFTVEDLEVRLLKVFKLGLEGLMVKALQSTYEPGKRYWLKMKKDYLLNGEVADSADLLVLGAWYGTGNKGNLKSIFLMGCYDEAKRIWRTVTKVHSGHDDATLRLLQTQLDMVKISQDPKKVPDWLKCGKTMIPDFVARDPRKMPVWEVTGAEFTRNRIHTADGISIRFPRVTRIRSDKDWKTATNFEELRTLYETSRDRTGFTLKATKPTATAVASTSSQPMDFEEEQLEFSEEVGALSLASSRFDNDDLDDGNEKSSDQERNSSENDGQSTSSGPQLKRSKYDSCDSDTEDDEPQDTGSVDKAVLDPLPDIFVGCVIQLPFKYKENDFLKRYLIAYGALVDEGKRHSSTKSKDKKVTHVVHTTRTSTLTKESFWADNVRHVHVTWVWDCLKTMKRQNERNYAIGCM